MLKYSILKKEKDPAKPKNSSVQPTIHTMMATCMQDAEPYKINFRIEAVGLRLPGRSDGVDR